MCLPRNVSFLSSTVLSLESDWQVFRTVADLNLSLVLELKTEAQVSRKVVTLGRRSK